MCDEKDQNFGATTSGSIMKTFPPTCPGKPQSLWLTTTWLSFPSSLLVGLSPCDFALFPKLEMKLKGQRFETVSDNQRELQAVLISIKENDFHTAFEVWKK
jgi:hypothetical protein